MLTKDDKLKIFEDFLIDRTLPKFKSRDQVKGDPNVDAMQGGVMMGSEVEFFTDDTSLISGFEGVRLVPRRRWYDVLFRRGGKRKKEERPEMSVAEFFHSIKDSAEELLIVGERAKGYEMAIEKAMKGGQTALKEQLHKNMLAVRSETQLIVMGLGRFIEENTVVKFTTKASRSLKLDWVKNFVRVIPPDVLAKKVEADGRSIFDNYVVLHYDPEGKNRTETEKEKAKRKDPILFGVIEGRRRLYFVGDWQDEFCDLTFDQIADVIGKGAIKDAKDEDFNKKERSKKDGK